MKEGSSFAASLLVGRKSPQHSRLLPNGFWNAHTHSLTQAERDRQAGIFRSVLPHTQEPNPTNPSKFFFCQSSSKTVRTIEAGHHTDGNEGGGLAGSAARKKNFDHRWRGHPAPVPVNFNAHRRTTSLPTRWTALFREAVANFRRFSKINIWTV